MRFLNWLFYTGLWSQPFVMYGLIRVMDINLSNIQKDINTGLFLLFVSFLPTLYI